MNFDLKLDRQEQTVKVEVTCQLNQELRKGILLAIAYQLGISGFPKVIIDLSGSTFNTTEPMLGALELTTYMRAIGIKPHVKFAFVYSEIESHRKYFKKIAQSDGFHLQYFKSLNEAEKVVFHVAPVYQGSLVPPCSCER